MVSLSLPFLDARPALLLPLLLLLSLLRLLLRQYLVFLFVLASPVAYSPGESREGYLAQTVGPRSSLTGSSVPSSPQQPHSVPTCSLVLFPASVIQGETMFPKQNRGRDRLLHHLELWVLATVVVSNLDGSFSSNFHKKEKF